MLRVVHVFDVKSGVQEASFIEWLDARLDEITKRYGCLDRKTWVFIDGIQGTVRLDALIATDGTVTGLKVVSGHPLLVKAALEAVERWRYRPTLLNGQPVEVETEIDVNFALEQ